MPNIWSTAPPSNKLTCLQGWLWAPPDSHRHLLLACTVPAGKFHHCQEALAVIVEPANPVASHGSDRVGSWTWAAKTLTESGIATRIVNPCPARVFFFGTGVVHQQVVRTSSTLSIRSECRPRLAPFLDHIPIGTASFGMSGLATPSCHFGFTPANIASKGRSPGRILQEQRTRSRLEQSRSLCHQWSQEGNKLDKKCKLDKHVTFKKSSHCTAQLVA
jgi:hypothetical protein